MLYSFYHYENAWHHFSQTCWIISFGVQQIPLNRYFCFQITQIHHLQQSCNCSWRWLCLTVNYWNYCNKITLVLEVFQYLSHIDLVLVSMSVQLDLFAWHVIFLKFAFDPRKDFKRTKGWRQLSRIKVSIQHIRPYSNDTQQIVEILFFFFGLYSVIHYTCIFYHKEFWLQLCRK